MTVLTHAADTHCPYCALQCGMRLHPASSSGALPPAAEGSGAGMPVEVTGREFPTNRSGLCRKGWTSAQVLSVGDRITQPLVRDAAGELVPTTWGYALDRIADEVRSTRAEHGADAVGIFGGGGLTNEKAYQLGKFARIALRTSRIDYNGRFCMSSAAAAGNRAFGVDRGLPFPVTDLDSARTILLLGSNPAATMPPLVSHLQGARKHGGLLVVDPRRSQTADLTADGAGMHLAPAPGTDLVLILGLTHIVLAQGWADAAYLDERTEGLDQVRRSVNQWWPHRVQEVTGVPVATLHEVARRLSARDGVYIITGRGVEQHVDGTATATAAINLALVLGLVGRPGAGYGTLTGQGNGQGGREHGQKCDQLPGYRMITDPSARAHVASVWGVDADELPGPGLPAVELLASLGRPGGVRTLFVHGSNVVISAPDARAVRARLEALDLLVVSDFVLSETAALADVVLPVTQWAEEEGTMTSLEGRVLRRRAAIAPPPEVRSELWVLAELARRLEAPGAWSVDPAEVFDELARASAGGPADYSGLSHELLDTGVAAYWPAPAREGRGARPAGELDETGASILGTPRLFGQGFPRPGGRAALVPVTATVREPLRQRGGELTLVTGRLLEHYQSGAQTRRVPELAEARPRLEAELHPATAARLGLAAGDHAVLANGRGRVDAQVVLSDGIRLDTVFLPFHFADSGCANLLTEAAVDPTSKMPEFKRTLVTVAHAPAPTTRRVGTRGEELVS